jgi:hypothetical protein
MLAQFHLLFEGKSKEFRDVGWGERSKGFVLRSLHHLFCFSQLNPLPRVRSPHSHPLIDTYPRSKTAHLLLIISSLHGSLVEDPVRDTQNESGITSDLLSVHGSFAGGFDGGGPMRG